MQGTSEQAASVEQAATPVLSRLRDITNESTQLYRRAGDVRHCVAAAERLSGLRDTVPVGAELPMTAGSAAQVLLAWESPEDAERLVSAARFSASTLTTVRRRGWADAEGQEERKIREHVSTSRVCVVRWPKRPGGTAGSAPERPQS